MRIGMVRYSMSTIKNTLIISSYISLGFPNKKKVDKISYLSRTFKKEGV